MSKYSLFFETINEGRKYMNSRNMNGASKCFNEAIPMIDKFNLDVSEADRNSLQINSINCRLLALFAVVDDGGDSRRNKHSGESIDEIIRDLDRLDAQSKGKAYYNVAIAYEVNKDYEKAAAYYEKSHEERAESIEVVERAYCQLGRLYSEYFKNYKKALSIYEKLADIYEKGRGDDDARKAVLASEQYVIAIYKQVACLHELKNDSNSAFGKCIKLATKLRLKIKEKNPKSTLDEKLLIEIGIILIQLGNFADALRCYDDIKVNKVENWPIILQMTYWLNKGSLHALLNSEPATKSKQNNDMALYCLEKATEFNGDGIAKKEFYNNIMMKSLNSLGDFHHSQNKQKLAIGCYVAASKLERCTEAL